MYQAVDNVTCSRTQQSDSASGEIRTSNPLILSLMLYQLLHTLWLQCFGYESKKDSKDQKLIQSSTTPDPGYHRGK